MQIPEVKEWIEEKNKLLIKIDTYDYKNEAEKEEDCKIVGELIFKIHQTTMEKIKEEQESISKQKPLSVIEGRKTTVKEAKHMLKLKYEAYRLLTLDARALVDELVEIKKQGRDIMERSIQVNDDDKQFIHDVMRL